MNFLQPRRGSVLILVLWTLCFLAMVVVSVSAGVRARLTLVDRLERRHILRGLANSGIARLMEDLVLPGTPDAEGRIVQVILPEGFILMGPGPSESGGRRAGVIRNVSNAERKLNVNRATQEQLSRLFEAIGRSESEAQAMAAAVLDWRDEDSEASGPYGAESPYYEGLGNPYPCKNAPFERLDELLLVRGFNAKILAVLEYLLTTVGEGPVQIENAAAPVIVALGMTPKLADKIVAYRSGKDMEPGTKDDIFKMDSYSPAETNPAVLRLRELTPVSKEEADMLTAALTDGRFGMGGRFFDLESSAGMEGGRGVFRVQALVERLSSSDGSERDLVKILSWRASFNIA